MKYLKYLIILLILIIPFNVKGLDISLKSDKVLLVNLNDDNFLYEKNIYDKTYIASITKVMTAIVVVDNIPNLQEKVLLKKEDLNDYYKYWASISELEVNKYYSYEELLYGLLLPSGSDCASALAREVAGSPNSFVKLMNEKAKELGMNNTSFANTTGLDDKNNYSTAYDIYLMMKYADSNETLSKILKTLEYKVGNTKLSHTITYYFNNYDINMPYLQGGKTGTEDKAGYCLASFATYDDVNYLLITLNAKNTPDHFLDAQKTYDYFMKNYSYQIALKKGDILYTLNTKYTKEKEYDIKATSNYNFFIPNDYDKDKIKITYDGLKTISYDNKVNDKIGTLKIYYEERLLQEEEVFLTANLHYSIISFYKQDNIALYTLCFLSSLATLVYLFKKKKPHA